MIAAARMEREGDCGGRRAKRMFIFCLPSNETCDRLYSCKIGLCLLFGCFHGFGFSGFRLTEILKRIVRIFPEREHDLLGKPMLNP